jgi:hypothetical protein
MWEVREAQTIIEAAERAASTGDHASAERLLREAARMQEANLGPRHADLANTLNNLGIVCEMTGKLDDAEQYFRRSVSIARTSLHPDHPFVATSQKNLRDFCETRGTQVELPAPVPEAPKPVPETTTPPADPEDSQLSATTLFRRVALGALGPIAMLMVVLAAGLPRLGAPELNAPVRETAIGVARDVTPLAEPSPVKPAPSLPTPKPAPATTVRQKAVVEKEVVEEEAADDVTPATTARPVVVRASLCGDLDEWSCDPSDNPVPAGPLFLYTQIKSTSAVTIHHRWYHNDRLLQTVPLRVQANRRDGYRTYSRNVMKNDSAGNWRVEVRSEDGALLHTERFTVH